MVKSKTVDDWNLPCFGYRTEDITDEVQLLWCRICKYYYGDKDNISQLQGRTKNQLESYVEGTHRSAHEIAFFALTDNPPEELKDLFLSSSSSSMNLSITTTRQATIGQAFRKMTTLNKEQLLKKFQLAHFIGVCALPSNMYEHIADFEKNIHGVNLGGGYLRRLACTEMIHFLAKDILYRNITNPLNSGEKHFYSLSDGSSNAKTMDEKELILIKTCD